MKKIKLGELCKPSAGQIKEDSDKLIDYIDISSVDNETKKVTGYQTIAFRDAPSRARKMVKRGSILVSTVRPNLNAVAMLEDDTPNITIASTGFCILDCKENANNRFIFNFCKSRAFIDDMVSQATGASYPAVSDKIVRSALVPDYSYEEQCKISEVLDSLSAVIDNRKAELSALDELIRARFVEMFGDMFLNIRGWQEESLESLADIVSGITKGRKIKEKKLIEVPYMAVSNVKNGYIDWTTVKTIEATEQEINQYRLLPDDVLMTEGGDPDKLGRGAIIREPLENCIHQNHIFRVRLNESIVLPDFFEEYLQHQRAKRYFLGCAKQTTGIASINMKQLRALPVLIPPLKLQQQFSDFVRELNKSKDSVQKALDEAQLLFDSLMQQYFG